MITKLFRLLGPEARPVRTALIGIVAGAILQGIGFVLIVPILDALFDGDTGRAWTWTAALAAVTVVYSIVHYTTQLTSYRAAVALARGLYTKLGDHIATLPLGWFSTNPVGKLGRLTSKGVIDVMGVPAHLLRPVVTAVVTPATVVVLMLLFDWRLALVAAITAPVAAVVYRWAGSLVRRADVRADAAAADSGERIVEFAQNQAVLRAFGRHVDGNQTLDDALVEHRNAGRALMVTAVPGVIAFAVVVQAAFVLIIVAGVNLTLDGDLGAAELIALLVLATRYTEPLALAADLGGSLRMAASSLERMETLLDTPAIKEPSTSQIPVDNGIEFEHVSFGYDHTKVIDDVTFAVPAGTMTALVGPSGSGKTTLTRLVARLWDVDTGTVRIGGANVRDLTTADLMSRLAMVFQETYLFDGTIADNLRLARADATDTELADVATQAQLDEVIARLPGGWNARVGEGGSSLSGGERQRVAIARALLKKSPILLLDEATAALDPANEVAVQNTIASLRRDRTIIVIAHRLQTVVAADQIIVLDDGRIAERGTHDELLAHNGRYAAFWNERTRASGWRLATTN